VSNYYNSSYLLEIFFVRPFLTRMLKRKTSNLNTHFFLPPAYILLFLLILYNYTIKTSIASRLDTYKSRTRRKKSSISISSIDWLNTYTLRYLSFCQKRFFKTFVNLLNYLRRVHFRLIPSLTQLLTNIPRKLRSTAKLSIWLFREWNR